ncbi:NAD(P)-binding protein [Trichocladium antarcticum]|uniref:NAD(P)-binding protein n=1 Tax=Trichocladium antarcticum TaxID=1450529 RepID=A0AAN6UU85_9PEZI|nr:NAD(P)-binding protein [Trichocladium antarcticum]
MGHFTLDRNHSRTMSRSLQGKLGIVTGSSRGIGAAIAENLASKGCNVVINYASDSSTPLAASLADRLSSAHNIRAVPVQADISTPAGATSLIAAARAHFPTSAVDILINNAGIARSAPLPHVTPADFDASYRVNVLGPLLVVQAAQPHLPRDRSGRIVNVSSVSAAAGFAGQSVYGGTKAALEAMTRTWARELAENATVNAVNPGPVEGPMYASNSDEFREGIRGWVMHTPLMRAREGVDSEDEVREARENGGRLARLGEIAGVVGMLCSAEAGWCTGQVVCANGGMLMH